MKMKVIWFCLRKTITGSYPKQNKIDLFFQTCNIFLKWVSSWLVTWPNVHWSRDLLVQMAYWELAHLMAQRCTKRTNLIEFQFKLLQRRILTNDFLLKAGRKVNDNCPFCNNPSETLIHLFWSCHVTSSFWKSVTDF